MHQYTTLLRTRIILYNTKFFLLMTLALRILLLPEKRKNQYMGKKSRLLIEFMKHIQFYHESCNFAITRAIIQSINVKSLLLLLLFFSQTMCSDNFLLFFKYIIPRIDFRGSPRAKKILFAQT